MENFSNEFKMENGEWLPTKDEISSLKKELASMRKEACEKKSRPKCDEKTLMLFALIKEFNDENGKWERDIEKWKIYDEDSSLAEYLAALNGGSVIKSAHRLPYRTEDVKNNPSIQKDGIILIDVAGLSKSNNNVKYAEKQKYALSKLISDSNETDILPTVKGRFLMKFVMSDVYVNTGISMKEIKAKGTREHKTYKTKDKIQRTAAVQNILSFDGQEKETADDYFDDEYEDEDSDIEHKETIHPERADEGFDDRYMGEDPYLFNNPYFPGEEAFENALAVIENFITKNGALFGCEEEIPDEDDEDEDDDITEEIDYYQDDTDNDKENYRDDWSLFDDFYDD